VQKVSVQSILVIILYVLNNKKYKSIKFKVKSFKKKLVKKYYSFCRGCRNLQAIWLVVVVAFSFASLNIVDFYYLGIRSHVAD